MRNLARLTNAVQPKSTFDGRKAPRCTEYGCRRGCERINGVGFISHCWLHATKEEFETYKNSWVNNDTSH